MKVRDIQNFRFFYKTGVRKTWDRNRDENFVGSSISLNGKTNFGFFDIYHGDKAEKEGIQGFLGGFLDMAQDSQAVYEFLQNAVDANSTTFEMYYDDEYFLAFNNGKQFNFEGIRSILNVGVSTKSQDSSNIGRFGIGFKLIHRLVGEKSGWEELKNLAGPILFSWNNVEQLIELQNFEQNSHIDFEEDNYYHIKNSNGRFGNSKNLPWLFKILLTNFPCQPEEIIRDLQYQEVSNAFEKREVIELANWANNKIKIDKSKHSLDNGALFFLKLGKNKGRILSNNRVENGIQFSLSILNNIAKFQGKQGISQIRVNENIFEAKKLFFERFVVKFGSDEYNQIKPQRRNEEDSSDIEILVGFMDYKTALSQIKGNPNFYLFFPLSEEVHNLSFIIHSTGFYNASQRTNLQGKESGENKEQGINENLLRVVVEKIKSKLLTYYNDTIKDEKFRHRFLNIYSNLLLSNKATESHKEWVDSCLIEPIFDVLKTHIPTKNGYSNSPENVKIKDTFLDISPSDFDCSEIEWFYWNNEKNDSILIDEARNSEKLNLDKWDIIDLIKYAIQQNKVDKINTWIKNIEFETSQIFAKEKKLKEANNLQEITRKPKPYFSLLSEVNKNILKPNFEFVAKIKLFKFSDGNFYSLNEIFESENLVLNYKKIFDIRFELQNIGFITSIINIDSINQKGIANYSNIKDLIQTKFSDLQLFQKIAPKVKLNTLRKDQKHKLFTALQEFVDVGAEKLRDLELFKNSQGEVCPLRNLLKGDLSVPNWLFHFKIHIAEYTPELDKYLVQEEEIYQQIIYPEWENIITETQDINNLYEKTVYYYGLKEDNKIFRTQKFVYTKDGFLLPSQVFFNSEMTKLGSQYVYFQNTIQSLFDLPTPEKQITPFFLKEPFKIDGLKFCGKNANIRTLEVYEIKSALSFCKLNNEQFFKNFIIKKSDNGFTIVPKTNTTYQITSPDNEARKFIDENCKDRLFVLPIEFLESKDEDGIIKADDLHSLILDCVDVNEHKKSLIDIVKYRAKYQFLQKLSEFRFNSEITYTKDDYEYKVLELACNELKESDYLNFKNKVVIEIENDILKLNISLSKNEFEVEDVKLSLSEILPDVHKNSSKLSKLINRFVSLGLPEDKINLLFGIKNEPEQTVIFNHLGSEYKTLQNGQQLAFVLLYAKTRNLNLSDFQLPEETKIDFIEFVYKRNSTILKELIISNKSISLLNFNPQKLVYPNEYAYESEQLPDYVQEWINNDNEKVNFLANLGVWINGTTIVDLRKFWKGDSTFDGAKLVREDRFDMDKTNLMNSFEYLKTNNIQLTTTEQYDIFEEAIKRRNAGCSSSNCYNIVKHYDFETIRQQIEEWDNDNYNAWKENKFFIYLFDGELPRFVKISGGFEDYVFYRFNEGDVVIDDNKIYLNKNADRKEILSKLASERNNFSFEDLWQLFGSNSISVELNDSQKEKLELTKDYTEEEVEEMIKLYKYRDKAQQIGIQALSNKGAIINEGKLGEEIVYKDLCNKFREERVRWTSSHNPKVSYGTPEYDFEILTEDLTEILYYVDAKSTITRKGQSDKTEIFWRNSEWNFIETKNPNNYLIARVFNCNSDNFEIVYLKVEKKDLFT